MKTQGYYFSSEIVKKEFFSKKVAKVLLVLDFNC